MNWARWVAAHQRSLLFLALVLVAGGIGAALTMPVSLFPNVAFPRIRVGISAGEQPARQMVLQVTRPVEEAIRRVRDVRRVRSSTSRGGAEIDVDFAWGTDMRRALLETDAAINQVLPRLPPNTRVDARRMDPTVYPVIAYSLTSKTLSLTHLRDIAEYQLRPLLTAIPGVADIGVQGGKIAEDQVDVDPAKLRALGLTLADVTRAVASAADLRGLGRLQDRYKLFLLLGNNQPTRLQALRDIVLRAGPQGAVRLADVARVRRATRPQWIRVTADGHDAVLLQVFQQISANSVALARQVRRHLAEFERSMPSALHIANWYDQSRLVVAAAGSVRDAILIGVLLAGLVLIAFLRNLRLVVVALAVVPAVLAITALLLRVAGQSFNMMTLGGMAAAVGLVIDDVIVMLEHIVRRLQDPGPNAPATRIGAAAWEFTRPLSGSSAATLIVFAPLAFLSGVTGAFFKALSLTMALALAVSWLLTWIVVPILARLLLDARHAREKPPGRIGRGTAAGYRHALAATLRRPWLALLGLLPLLALGAAAWTQVGSGFMPRMDEGGFILDYYSAPGTSLDETNRLLDQVGAILRHDPAVDTYSRRTGTQLGGGLTEANQGDFFVRLKSADRPPIWTVMRRVRAAIAQRVPGLHIETAQLMEDLIGDLTAVPQPIEVKLYGDQASQLEAAAQAVRQGLTKLSGITEVRSGVVPAGDALDVRVDPQAAAALGLTPAAVMQQVHDAVNGRVVAQLPEPPKMVGVRVWLRAADRARVGQIRRLPIALAGGRTVPLAQIARVTAVAGQNQIMRENLKRMVSVTARTTGISLGGAAAEVKAMLARPGLLPQGVYARLGGLYHQQQIAFHGLMIVLAAAVALVFALLLYLYERLSAALAIIAMPLAAMAAVFVGLWLTGVELNISALMGMTMIVGIVTEIAIFYFSELDTLRAAEPDIALPVALAEAGRHRLRPILMSVCAAILTLLPLALALGAGAQMQQPLAVAIIAGLIAGAPLVLLVMPGLYLLLEGLLERRPRAG